MLSQNNENLHSFLVQQETDGASACMIEESLIKKTKTKQKKERKKLFTKTWAVLKETRQKILAPSDSNSRKILWTEEPRGCSPSGRKEADRMSTGALPWLGPD